MRWRAVALISLGVNLALAALWVVAVVRPLGRSHSQSSLAQSDNSARTNTLVRRQIFSWTEIESPDYLTYINNLRSIGCPEQTIRDIIIADVNGYYARRRAQITTPEQQWWRSEPDSNVVLIASQKMRDLEDERRTLLTRLLGNAWETGDMINLPRPTRPGLILDGPVLGDLPAETKQNIEEVVMRSQDRLTAYLEAQQREGKELDPVELARLRSQTRADLQRLLGPAQLEEFLLRYSQDANNLRSQFGQLRFFNATPDEFRAVFRATDVLDQQIDTLAGNDPASAQQRKALEDQRENAIRVALGPARYAEYRALQEPAYRDAVALAEQAGTPDAAKALYAINLTTLAEQARIRGDTNLTAEQKNIELKRLELEQLQANAVATDQELPPEPAPTPAPPPRKVFIVGPGDTAATVATIYGLPLAALRAANPGVDLSKLRPGDSLTIPRNPLAPSPGP
ncbi:MAG: hypothetical protein C5B50_23440 [Verrucomicrobia bacterium]|nr:MAG: hypothetical protein C5B50_23440 [Verrucomicrobiota bacterium]